MGLHHWKFEFGSTIGLMDRRTSSFWSSTVQGNKLEARKVGLVKLLVNRTQVWAGKKELEEERILERRVWHTLEEGVVRHMEQRRVVLGVKDMLVLGLADQQMHTEEGFSPHCIFREAQNLDIWSRRYVLHDTGPLGRSSMTVGQ